MNIYDFKFNTISGEETCLEQYKGKNILIVNTASKCGFTKQFSGLETLYKKYKDNGFVIIGFPCNQFLHQDPKSSSEISEFCKINFGVTFPMMEKIMVRTKEKHPLYEYLIKNTGGKAIKWNFTKFLIDKNGEILNRFEPKTTPEEIDPEISKLI